MEENELKANGMSVSGIEREPDAREVVRRKGRYYYVCSRCAALLTVLHKQTVEQW